MERSRLDDLTHAQLRTEAKKCGLSATGDRVSLIDAIMTYWETHAGQQKKTERPEEPSTPTDTQPATLTPESVAQMFFLVSNQMQQQTEVLQQLLLSMRGNRNSPPREREQASLNSP